MVRDELHSKTKGVEALPPQQLTASFDPATAPYVIDLHRANTNDVWVNVGAVAAADGSNYFTFKLVESDSAVLAGHTDVAAADCVSNGVASTNGLTLNATSQANGVLGHIYYRGVKRYIGIKATETGTADAFVGAHAVLGGLPVQPSGANI